MINKQFNKLVTIIGLTGIVLYVGLVILSSLNFQNLDIYLEEKAMIGGDLLSYYLEILVYFLPLSITFTVLSFIFICFIISKKNDNCLLIIYFFNLFIIFGSFMILNNVIFTKDLEDGIGWSVFLSLLNAVVLSFIYLIVFALIKKIIIKHDKPYVSLALLIFHLLITVFAFPFFISWPFSIFIIALMLIILEVVCIWLFKTPVVTKIIVIIK